MSPLNTVIRLWGNPPEVPAQKALWLASSATDGKTGLAVDVLSPGMLVGGALRELGRRILGRPPRFPETTFREVPWNAPFYTRLGFAMLDELTLPAGLAAKRDQETRHGLPPESRCAMRLAL